MPMGSVSRECFRAVFGLLLGAATALPAASIHGYDGLTVTVSPSGSYEVAVRSPAWRFAGTLGVPAFNLTTGSGTDAVGGAYSEISFDFFTDAPRHATIRSYSALRAVLFTASVPSGAPNTFAFPALGKYPAGLKHIAFAGTFAYPTFYGSNSESPAVFFDSAFNTFILSPASHFMVASTQLSSSGELDSGICSKIDSLPAGFAHQTLLVIDTGINRAFDKWGSLLTALTGKTRPANDADVTLSRLGYWTDAGSAYYYATEPGLSYPETLLAVKTDFDRQGVPLGYLQLDSWFYPKGAAADWLSRADGIYEYYAAAPPFSSSLAAFQSSLGLPLITHSRWIDPQSPYRNRYRMSGNVSTDPLFWGEIAGYLAGSGVAGYEQDWLADRAATDFNLTDGDDFLDNMASALGQQNISIQYCTGTGRHFLQSAKYNNLTTIRASQDRFDRTRWTKFLYASRLASAVGVWPFSDVLMSGETDNLLLATLSAGPVGVGDRIGTLSAANLLRAIRPDGVIVKPDVPLTPLDTSFWSDSNNSLAPMIAATYSDFGGWRGWYVFVYPQGDNTLASFRLSDVGLTQPAYLYDYFGGAGRVVAPEELLEQDVPAYSYQIAVPIGISGMALLGDTGHFVSLGKKRIAALSDDGIVHVTVAFAAGESSRTLRGYSPDPPSASAVTGAVGPVRYDPATSQFAVEVTPGADGTASLQIWRVPGSTDPAGPPPAQPVNGR